MYGRTYPSTTGFSVPAASDAGANSHFDLHGSKGFVAPQTREHGTPRYSSQVLATAIAPPSRFCTPSPTSVSHNGSNYSYSHDTTFSPHGSQTSFCTAPSASAISLCHGQPSPDPSQRDSRAQSPANKAFRAPPSRAGFRTQSPFHRLQTPVSRLQSPVHRLQSPALGLRSQTPAIGARVHVSFVNAGRLPPGRTRGLSSTSIDYSLQRPLRRQSKPEEPEESEDCVMGDSDGCHASHHAFGEQQTANQTVFDQTDDSSQNPGGGRHEHPAPPCPEEPTQRPAQDRRYPPEEDGSGPSPPADSPGSTTTSSSNLDASSPASSKTDEPHIGQTMRVLRGILEDEYDLRLGISDPPQDMVDAVSLCLRRLSLSLDRQRSLGCVVMLPSFLADGFAGDTADTVTFTSTGGGSSQNNRKRGALSNKGYNEDYNEDIHDEDPDEDGGGACVDPNMTGARKKVKVEQLACPFRKRNPLRHNCREWEYCSKAPFKSMSDLKKHIIRFHCQAELSYKCPRCQEAFPRQADVDAHLRQDPGRICQMIDRVASPNLSSDGTVSYSVAERLRSRTELDWRGLWQILFPHHGRHQNIPDSNFEPVVELHEISHEYKSGQRELLANLSSGLDDLLGTHSEDDPHHLPTNPDPRAVHILAIVDRFMGDVLRKAQGQAATGPSYPRPRRGAGPPDRTLETSQLLRGMVNPPPTVNSPRSPSTVSTSTASGPRYIRSRQLPTPTRSNGTASPATSIRQAHTPNLGIVQSLTLDRSNSRRSLAVDQNAAQDQGFLEQRSLPEHTLNFSSSVTSFNHRAPERVGNRHNSALGSPAFATPEPAVTRHHDAVSQQATLHNFAASSNLGTRQLPPDVAAFQNYNNHSGPDFTLPDTTASSPSSLPWSTFNLGFSTPGIPPSPGPVNMTEAELQTYIGEVSTEPRSVELERSRATDSSLDSVVMGGSQDVTPRWTGQHKQHQGYYVQPRHGTQ